MTVNFAILGLGRIGITHLNALLTIKDAHIAGVCDPYHPNIDELAADYGTSALSYDEVLNNQAIDAVLICTPTAYHAAQIKDCVDHKKAIFCEKPIDLDYAVAQQSVHYVNRHDGRLMIGFNRRFDPQFMHLKACIDQGDIGQIEMVQITSRDPAPPSIDYIKNSGGLFKDMMIHDIDMARFLTDDDITEVQAMGANLVDPVIGEAGDIDSAMLQARTSKGALISITNSRRTRYGYDQRIEVHGSKGMLKAGNCHEHTVALANENGFMSARTVHFFMERYKQAYQNEMVYFAEALKNNIPFSPNGEDALKALKIADVATFS